MNKPEWLSQNYTSPLSKALKADMTPISVDTQNQSAKFYSKDTGEYATTLNNCTCKAFYISQNKDEIPFCKHMVRLALELNIIPNDNMQSDFSVVKINMSADNVSKFIKSAPHDDVLPFIRFLEDTYSTGHPKSKYKDIYSNPMFAFMIEDNGKKLKWSKKGISQRSSYIKSYNERCGKELRNK